MLEAAVQGVRETSVGERPLLLGVTLLTSMSEQDMCSLGIKGKLPDVVLDLARIAHKAGLDGVVASAQEAVMIKQVIGKDFLVVTPGIRPEWSSSKEDQKRTLTPSQAIANGADYIVVGRPIIQAPDPAKAARKIIEEM